MNKKILIPVAILLAVMLLFSVFTVVKNKKSKKSQISTEHEVEISDNDEVTSKEPSEVQTEESNKDDVGSELLSEDKVIVFGNGNGEVILYSLDGKILDFVEISKIDIGEYEKVFNEDEGEDEDEDEDEEEEVTEKEDKEEEKEGQYAYISTPEGMIKTEIRGDKIIIYDKDGNEVNSISLDDKAEHRDDLFTLFRTNSNELVFRDWKRNALIEVDIVGNQIKTTLLFKNMNLEKLNNLYITEEDLYLTFNDNTNIHKLTKKAAVAPSDIRKVEKYDIGAVPNFSIYQDGFIYFATPYTVGKYDVSIDEGEILEIITGDRTSDIYIEDGFMYIVNDFGSGKDNSVLMKVEQETLKTKGIMELKGLNSKFVGITNDLAYIRQTDSIKEVNLKTFKPVTSRDRTVGVPVQVVEDTLYSLVNGKLRIADKKDSKTLDSFDVKGFSFHIITY